MDDHPAQRYLLTNVLRRAGFAPREASTGEEALRLALAEPPDLVLLDVKLPDIPGFEVSRRLRAHPATAHVPIVQMSAAFTTSTDRVHGLQGGADTFLVAPVDPDELVATLSTVLRRQSVSQERARQLEAERSARAELEALNAALAGQARILENVRDSVIVTDLEGRITHWNVGAEALFGYTADEVLGHTPALLYPEQDLSSLPEDLSRILHGEDYRGEWKGRHRDGRELWVDVRTTLLRGPGGAPAGFVGVGKDITERRRAEQERDRFFVLSQELLCIADLATGVVRRVNPAWERLLGYAPAALVGQRLRELEHPEDQAAAAEELARLGQGQSTARFECRFRHADGSYRWVSWNAAPDVEAGVLYAAGRDVTEQRRQAEAERRRAEFEQQLIGIVSHDLRNPIAAISLSAATLLSREGLDERQRRVAGRVLSSAERANRLVRDLLDFTRARMGSGIPITRASVDLHALTQQVVDELQVTHPGRALHVHQEGEATLLLDADRAAQVIANLVGNALQHGAADSGVQVCTRGLADEVLLEVHNRGRPIPGADLPYLFEPMRRGSDAGEDAGAAGKSVGLGLYIAQQIALAHGGRVEVQSSEAGGTLFRVHWPRRAP
ncbi:PAS domain S-box protein [Aggregicoccus sp. 17bor-14]|uniref:hybrid sensor histidine kinase/response regulator n=1 Tax=Myxococcaceae TaxID=31 RepID=UPI00129C284F|nr:PAS domain S-box protein [Simulacricoccus sp. 17bor-14]MRI91038.1 PAS domain S-box protein [Aggregicoccus sp. 17bor-14]